MFDSNEAQQLPSLESDIKETIRRGEEYAAALLFLDPRLKGGVNDSDIAIGFDVGGGADGIAFSKLGFRKTYLTNSPSVDYQLHLRNSAERESIIYQRVQNFFPAETYYSHLGVSDWLDRQLFSPILAIMLRIAPAYFYWENDPMGFFSNFIGFAERLKPPATIILSALDDDNALPLFIELSDKLQVKSLAHDLKVGSDIPPKLQVLGQRILTIKK